jgi:hypothetical protein
MRLRPLWVPLKWLIALLVLAGLAFGAYLVNGLAREEQKREGDNDRVQSRQRFKDGAVTLDRDEVERLDLRTAPVRAEQWYERVPVYGRVVANPRATVEVRSPFAGTLRAASEGSWPVPGRQVKAEQVIGWLDVRVGPDVRLELRNKLSEARIKQRGAEEEVRLQQSRVDSLNKVTSKGFYSRDALDAALVQLAQAKTQLATAEAATRLWQKALDEVGRHNGADSPWSAPLQVPAGGEVTELAARPGMTIEAGALVARVVDFSRPLVRLDFPPEVTAAGAPARLDLVATPAPGNSLTPSRPARPAAALAATLVGPAPQVDPASQFAGFWYEVKLPARGGVLWRPGLQVKAEVRPPDAKPQPAVSVPAEAVLYHEGRTLVYVQVEKGKYKFQRREVTLLGNTAGRWVLARRQGKEPTGLAPGETVVAQQAQLLLSEEFRGAAGDAD